MKKIKISGTQLSFLIMGFMFGDTVLINPASSVGQDSWWVYSLAWIVGIVLIAMYAYIARLNPSKNLIEIIREHFGYTLGTIIGIAYVGYFIHTAALILRNFGEYMVIVNYPETPILFIIICLSVAIAYGIKKGLEVMARVNEVVVPLLLLSAIVTFFALFNQYDIHYLLPMFQSDRKAMGKVFFSVLTFPFGQAVVFLMVFLHLNQEKKVLKVSVLSILFIGFIILITIFRDLLLLGPDLITKSIFPPEISTRLIPVVNIDPLIAVNLLIGGGIKITIFIYAAVVGLTQLFNFDDYKPFVFPIVAITIALSIWIYNNFLESIQWKVEVWPYYSIPFQFMVPILLLVISWIKKRKIQK